MKRKKALNEAEKEAINDINAANELLSDRTTKLANSLRVLLVRKGSKKASLMIETAKINQKKAKTQLATVRDKQRILSDKNKELIERALPGLPSRKCNVAA